MSQEKEILYAAVRQDRSSHESPKGSNEKVSAMKKIQGVTASLVQNLKKIKGEYKISDELITAGHVEKTRVILRQFTSAFAEELEFETYCTGLDTVHRDCKPLLLNPRWQADVRDFQGDIRICQIRLRAFQQQSQTLIERVAAIQRQTGRTPSKQESSRLEGADNWHKVAEDFNVVESALPGVVQAVMGMYDHGLDRDTSNTVGATLLRSAMPQSLRDDLLSKFQEHSLHDVQAWKNCTGDLVKLGIDQEAAEDMCRKLQREAAEKAIHSRISDELQAVQGVISKLRRKSRAAVHKRQSQKRQNLSLEMPTANSATSPALNSPSGLTSSPKRFARQTSSPKGFSRLTEFMVSPTTALPSPRGSNEKPAAKPAVASRPPRPPAWTTQTKELDGSTESSYKDYDAKTPYANSPRRTKPKTPDWMTCLETALSEMRSAVDVRWGSAKAAAETLSTQGGEVGGNGRISVKTMHLELQTAGSVSDLEELCLLFEIFGVVCSRESTISPEELLRVLNGDPASLSGARAKMTGGWLGKLQRRRRFMRTIESKMQLVARVHVANVRDVQRRKCNLSGETLEAILKTCTDSLQEEQSSQNYRRQSSGGGSERTEQFSKSYLRLSSGDDSERTLSSAFLSGIGLSVMAKLICSSHDVGLRCSAIGVLTTALGCGGLQSKASSESWINYLCLPLLEEVLAPQSVADAPSMPPELLQKIHSLMLKAGVIGSISADRGIQIANGVAPSLQALSEVAETVYAGTLDEQRLMRTMASFDLVAQTQMQCGAAVAEVHVAFVVLGGCRILQELLEQTTCELQPKSKADAELLLNTWQQERIKLFSRWQSSNKFLTTSVRLQLSSLDTLGAACIEAESEAGADTVWEALQPPTDARRQSVGFLRRFSRLSPEGQSQKGQSPKKYLSAMTESASEQEQQEQPEKDERNYWLEDHMLERLRRRADREAIKARKKRAPPLSLSTTSSRWSSAPVSARQVGDAHREVRGKSSGLSARGPASMPYMVEADTASRRDDSDGARRISPRRKGNLLAALEGDAENTRNVVKTIWAALTIDSVEESQDIQVLSTKTAKKKRCILPDLVSQSM